MKSAQDGPLASRAADAADHATPTAGPGLVDRSEHGMALQALGDLARHGPAALAQRRVLAGVFGPAARLPSARELAPAPAPAAAAPVQRVLDTVTRRVKAEEKVDWQAVLTGNGFTALDIRKISILPGNPVYLAGLHPKLLAEDAELDGLGGLSAHQKTKKKLYYKDRIENIYGRMISFAEVELDKANARYQAAVDAGAALIETFKQRTDRQFPNGNPVKPGAALIKEEKEVKLPPLVEALRTADIAWGTAEVFFKRVMERYVKEATAPAPVDPLVAAAIATEQGRVNTQLGLWATVADNAPGVNPNGTWGTSAGGAGGGFAATTLTAAAWEGVRKWWLAKANAFVTPSETTTWSLKMDRVPAVDGLSERFNYHINVA